MNKHVSALKPATIPAPTYGAAMLAADDASDISYALTLAGTCERRQWFDEDQYNRHIGKARAKLADLARRLGYDVVPSREVVDA